MPSFQNSKRTYLSLHIADKTSLEINCRYRKLCEENHHGSRSCRRGFFVKKWVAIQISKGEKFLGIQAFTYPCLGLPLH